MFDSIVPILANLLEPVKDCRGDLRNAPKRGRKLSGKALPPVVMELLGPDSANSRMIHVLTTPVRLISTLATAVV